jgi:NADPH:quinone reductase-like Zn-dependent oxidoreductase
MSTRRTVKAIVYTRYGPADVLELREVAVPAPKEDQVLVKVHAASASALDAGALRRFRPWVAQGK